MFSGELVIPSNSLNNIGTIEAAPNVILSKLLRTVADLLEQRCVGKQADSFPLA